MPTKIQNDLERISTFDPTLWTSLKDQRIFATGCTGFIGTWVIESFIHANKKFNLNAELVLLTRNKVKNEKKYPEVKWVEGDIQNFSFPHGNFDYVIHGATEVATFQSGENPTSLLDVSYLGTKKILEFSKQKNAKKILFLSSGAAYGTQATDLKFLSESHLCAPDVRNSKSTYGEAKRIGELLLFNENIPATSARIFATCGPHAPMESQYAFSNFLESCLKDTDITINSNGRTMRSFLYIADLTLWLWLLLLKGKDKEIYNVGSQDEISIHDLANKMKLTLNKKMNIKVLGTEETFGRYIPSNKKIRDEFGIHEMISLEESIIKSYDFLKEEYAVSIS